MDRMISELLQALRGARFQGSAQPDCESTASHHQALTLLLACAEFRNADKQALVHSDNFKPPGNRAVLFAAHTKLRPLATITCYETLDKLGHRTPPSFRLIIIVLV